MKALLIAASLATSGIQTTVPELTCRTDDGLAGRMVGFVPTFRSGDVLPSSGTFRLALRPSSEVRFFAGSTRGYGDEDGYGGLVTFPRLSSGRYRIRMSHPAKLELLQNYRRLTSSDASSERPGAEVELADGALVLQIRGAATDAIVISIAAVQPCGRD